CARRRPRDRRHHRPWVVDVIRRHGKGLRRRRWHELRERRSKGIFLLPSLLTTGNLFCGFFALLLTVENRYTEAALAIFVAMLMDILDGRVARLMKATTQFGLEFDSLADVVSFCVAPAFLIYSFALSVLGRPAWFGAFLFVICGALRVMVLSVMIVATRHELFLFLIFTGYAASGPIRRLIVGRTPAALPVEQAVKEHP